MLTHPAALAVITDAMQRERRADADAYRLRLLARRSRRVAGHRRHTFGRAAASVPER